MRKVSASEIRRRVEEALNLVQLTGLHDRYPRQLSGGQQQRVALARAIVIEPYVLLLDEPLSNLDAKLRKAMQTEVRDLQQRLGITAIYVTHDQEEAMTVSDRIVVMNRGRIMQIGSPTEIYRHPANEFVAGFIGQVNLVRGQLTRQDQQWTFVGERDLSLPIPLAAIHADARVVGQPVELAVRPEAIILESPDATAMAMSLTQGVVNRVVYTGASTTYSVQLQGGQGLQVVDQDRPHVRRWNEGETVAVGLIPESLNILPASTQS